MCCIQLARDLIIMVLLSLGILENNQSSKKEKRTKTFSQFFLIKAQYITAAEITMSDG